MLVKPATAVGVNGASEPPRQHDVAAAVSDEPGRVAPPRGVLAAHAVTTFSEGPIQP